jgi:predicted nucleic acid-binding protein
MSAERTVYLDSSALVKLVVEEEESDALRFALRSHSFQATCALARVEVPRAVRDRGPGALERARRTLDGVDFIDLDDTLLDAAAVLGPPARSLDAVHLAAAMTLEDELSAVMDHLRPAHGVGGP